jgi:hypothetical protein
MAKNKKQHYVPQCYLRRFTNANQGLLAFDKVSGTSYPTTTHDAAQERYFYDLPPDAFQGQQVGVREVEKTLAEIEGDYCRQLGEFLAAADRGGVSHGQIDEFSPYVVLQWMRTKSYREVTFELLQKAGQAFVDPLVEANFPGEKVKVTLDRKSLPALHAEQFFDPERVRRFAFDLQRHLWVIGINKTCTTRPIILLFVGQIKRRRTELLSSVPTTQESSSCFP